MGGRWLASCRSVVDKGRDDGGHSTASTVSGGPLQEDIMRRTEVLSLLERFPELVDGDDDELLPALFAEAATELGEKEDERSTAQSISTADPHDRTAKRPR